MATNTFDYFNKLAGGSSAPISLNGNVPVVTPQVPATGAVGGVPALDPLSTLLAGLLTPQGQKQGGLDFGAVLQHLFPGDPVGEQNRLSGPGGKLSPFTTGFFKTQAERDAMRPQSLIDPTRDVVGNQLANQQFHAQNIANHYGEATTPHYAGSQADPNFIGPTDFMGPLLPNAWDGGVAANPVAPQVKGPPSAIPSMTPAQHKVILGQALAGLFARPQDRGAVSAAKGDWTKLFAKSR